MRFSFVYATVFAAAPSVLAQTSGFDAITTPSTNATETAGTSMDIVWEPAGVTGNIKIQLLQGATPDTLQLGQIVIGSQLDSCFSNTPSDISLQMT